MDPDDMEELFGTSNSIADESILKIDLTKAIISLPYTYRSVIILRDIRELSTYEVSNMLEISPEAVKSRLHRARNIIRKKLEISGHSH
ncbi:sigma-70 family RNA polymerase sigma factor [Gilliamella sp. Occ4-3]|uniref:sigma-70 family RNA polymerase sigma factor n=2 Tax=Orbaceae TaxID=1240483 RepID=UPI00080DEE3A|nr:sigma-70 family RNA polymerase sigma factor [Gilliamella apicola]OCG76861.1 hypothetical protein A9G44_06550 [Gilliamella apicola]